MKKIAIVFLLFCVFLSGCAPSKKADNDITRLQAEIDILNSQIETLKQEKEETNLKIEELEYKVAVGRGFAVMYMDDLNIVYDELNCPIYDVENEDEKILVKKVIAKLSDDENYLDKKIFSISNVTNEEDGVYYIQCLMFTPVNRDALAKSIEEDTVVPFNSIRAYAIKVTTSGDNFDYEVN